MKKVVSIVGSVALIAFLVSCGASNPAPVVAPVETKPAVKVNTLKPEIVNHKNYLMGGDPPAWVTMTVQELEDQPKYKDFYVYVGEATGKSKEGAELVAKNFAGLAPFAAYLKQRVQNIFVGAQAGDQDKIETYMENIVKNMSDAEFSGFRQVETYWVEYKYPNKETTEFIVKILFTIDRAIVKKLIETKLDGEKEDTPEKVETKSKVKKLIEGALPALE